MKEIGFIDDGHINLVIAYLKHIQFNIVMLGARKARKGADLTAGV